MSLKYFVHVSSISNLSDARYCSGMMVDSLGYNLDENSNNILSIEKSQTLDSNITNTDASNTLTDLKHLSPTRRQ